MYSSASRFCSARGWAASSPCWPAGQHDVLADGEVGDDPVGLAILGGKAEPGGDRRARIADIDRTIGIPRLAGLGGPDAIEQFGAFGAARAQKPRQPDDLALVYIEIERLDDALPPDIAEAERDGALALSGAAARRALDLALERVAEHVFDEFYPVDSGRILGDDPAPVAQHRDAVGNGEYLIEKWR